MRGALGMVFGGVALVLVGCAPDDAASGLRQGSRTSTGAAEAPAPTEDGPAIAAAGAEDLCAAVAAPASLSDADDVREVRIAGSAVFYQSLSKVFRVQKDGSGKRELYTSKDLVHSYVDDTAMMVVETTGETPDATLRVIKATAPAEGAEAPAFPDFPTAKDGLTPGVATATNYNAAGSRVFASDATSFYMVADAPGGNAIVKVNKDNPAARTTIVQTTNVISNPQIAAGAAWYVRDGQRIFKVTLGDEANGIPQGEPTEVFGIGYATCRLAVNDTAAFCSVGTALERRDLSGANPATVIDEEQSKASAPFGATLAHDGTLFVRSEAPDEVVQHVIRAIEPSEAGAEESFVACGRGAVTDLVVDDTSVVWAEAAGLFVAPR